MERTHVLLCPASEAWCWDKALAKGQEAVPPWRKKPHILKGCETYLWSSFLVLCFHRVTMKNMNSKKTGVYPFFLGNPIDTCRKLQSSNHYKMKRYNFNYDVLSSAFGSDFCVFKQKHDFLGLQQCLWMSVFPPELDCSHFWAREISFSCVSALPITLPVLNKWF